MENKNFINCESREDAKQEACEKQIFSRQDNIAALPDEKAKKFAT
jgi:hypothetical protein